MALATSVFEGLFDRFPTIRMGFLEAGCGWLPDLVHAFHEHWEKRIRDFDPGARMPRRLPGSSATVGASTRRPRSRRKSARLWLGRSKSTNG